VLVVAVAVRVSRLRGSLLPVVVVPGALWGYTFLILLLSLLWVLRSRLRLVLVVLAA
jgi:hypothetical protein